MTIIEYAILMEPIFTTFAEGDAPPNFDPAAMLKSMAEKKTKKTALRLVEKEQDDEPAGD